MENPDWYIEWLGTVDRRYPAWYSDLRTPLLSVATPSPPVERDRVMKQFDRIASLPGRGQAIPKDFHALSLDSSKSGLRSNRVVSLSGF